MAGESPTETVAHQTHLARVRDNQRRSRARRKEYLQELEEKHRRCEQQGVQASAEVQHAARRVLDENKRLRAALRAKGSSEEEIEGYARGAGFEDATHNLQNLMLERKPSELTISTKQENGKKGSTSAGTADETSSSREFSTSPDLPPLHTNRSAYMVDERVSPQQRIPYRENRMSRITLQHRADSQHLPTIDTHPLTNIQPISSPSVPGSAHPCVNSFSSNTLNYNNIAYTDSQPYPEQYSGIVTDGAWSQQQHLSDRAQTSSGGLGQPPVSQPMYSYRMQSGDMPAYHESGVSSSYLQSRQIPDPSITSERRTGVPMSGNIV